MAKKTTFEVHVKLAPVSGSPTRKTVTVEASATVAEVAKAAGVKDLDRKNFLVNGRPAESGTRVTANSKVTISERPQGS